MPEETNQSAWKTDKKKVFLQPGDDHFGKFSAGVSLHLFENNTNLAFNQNLLSFQVSEFNSFIFFPNEKKIKNETTFFNRIRIVPMSAEDVCSPG